MAGTVHVYPRHDLIDHDTGDDGHVCVCGPLIEHVPTDRGDGWLVTHRSLDGREQHEVQR